jgi:DNA-binding NarL/FixJ family response regulator
MPVETVALHSTSNYAPGILVIDHAGEVFGQLRRLEVGCAVWRSARRMRFVDFTGIPLVVVASYGTPDWRSVAELSQRVRTVIVTVKAVDAEAEEALRLGAFGYLDAALDGSALARALLGAMRGEPAYPRRVLATHLALNGSRNRAKLSALTPRQREVVALIAKGAADKEIGRALGITTATAQKHVTNVLKRLNVPNRAAAVAATYTLADPP